MTQRVFVDANVLFSKTLYDWLFILRMESEGGLFQLYTSWDVIGETVNSIRNEHPTWTGKGISSLMEKIQKNFDEIVKTYRGGEVQGIADHGDWHVHHAAEACRADILLTQDDGFESDETHYEVYKCDDFFLEIARSSPATVRRTINFQLPYWNQINGKNLHEALEDADCPEFAKHIHQTLKEIALGR